MTKQVDCVKLCLYNVIPKATIENAILRGKLKTTQINKNGF